jgi:hypothetical protein
MRFALWPNPTSRGLTLWRSAIPTRQMAGIDQLAARRK